MTDHIANSKTSLSSEEVIARSVEFFSAEKFKVTSRSGCAATFVGRPAPPWGMLLLTVLGFLLFVVPGVVMYVMVIRRRYRFSNLLVTAGPVEGGTEVSISSSPWAATLAARFLGALPSLAAPAMPPQ